MQADDPIIIFGAPRSGTTYLNAIINKHPGVFVTHETRVFAWLHEATMKLTERPQMVTSHKAEFIEHLRRFAPELIRSFYRELNPSVERWGDKNPHYASPDNEGTLPMISEIYPRSQFIHIVRDGRDVVSSLIRKRKPNGDPWIDFDGAHRVWTGHVDVATAFCASLPDDRAFELRYEDLIEDDLGWAEKVIGFLGLEMTGGIESFCLSQQKERTPLSGPTRDLQDVGQSDWSAVLGREEQLASLDLIGEHLVRYGYETADSLTSLRSGR